MLLLPAGDSPKAETGGANKTKGPAVMARRESRSISARGGCRYGAAAVMSRQGLGGDWGAAGWGAAVQVEVRVRCYMSVLYSQSPTRMQQIDVRLATLIFDAATAGWLGS